VSVTYLVTALVSLFLADRFVVPIRRRSGILLVLVPLVFVGEALISGAVFAPIKLAYVAPPLSSYAADYGMASRTKHAMFSDVYSQMIPWRAAVRASFASGEWPLLNRFMLCGDPLAGSSQPAAYHPLNLIALALPLATSLTFVAAATLFLATLSAYLLLRLLGAGEEASVIAGAGWAFCGFLFFFLEWPIGLTIAVAPFLCAATIQLIRVPSRRNLLCLTSAFVLILLGGHPESAFHVVVIGMSVGVAALIGSPRPKAAVMTALGAALLALGLTAFSLLPAWETLKESSEFAWRSEHYAEQHRGIAWAAVGGRALATLVPFRYGVAGRSISGPETPWEVWATAYAGSILLGPALYALLFLRRRAVWFFGALFAVTLLVSLNAPFFADAVASFPLLDVSLNERFSAFAALALVVLAALGLDAWSREDGRRWLLPLVSLATTVMLLVPLRAVWLAAHEDGLPLQLLQRQTTWYIAPMIAAAIVMILLRNRRHAALVGVLLLLLAQRRAEVSSFHYVSSRDAFFPQTPEISAIPRPDEPFRIVAQSYNFIPNISTLYGLEDARGYNAIRLKRFREVLGLWSEEQSSWFNRVDRLGEPMLSFLNVRYAFAAKNEPLPDGWRLLFTGRDLNVVENLRVLPRAFLPRSVIFNSPLVKEEMAATPDFGAVAWIEEGGVPSSMKLNGSGTVVVRRKGSALHLQTTVNEESWVVVSEAAWSGWRATLEDGTRLPLRYANHAFLAIRVPRGAHSIDLFYRPRAFETGLAISIAALAVVGVMLFWPAVRRA
jgi:hypothetical protein